MLSDVIARLRAEAPVLKLVAGAAELSVLEAAPKLHLLPAAWVIPLEERGAAPDLIGSALQSVTAAIGVVLAVAGARADTAGAAQAQALEEVRRAVRPVLLGWVPPGCTDPLRFLSGALLRVMDGCVWWQDTYETSFEIDDASPGLWLPR